ncbi:type II CAAX prenyl endopeptidase Rce1 family protein [Chloroflexota bacterium]
MIEAESRTFNPSLELLTITGGLFLFTALYYTRIPRYQLLSVFVLIAVAFYFTYVVRRGPGMSWQDLKLTKDKLWRNVFIGIGLAAFGWLYFSIYNYWTRGQFLELGYGGSFAAILTIIAVSVAEELFFRGYLQNRLSYRYPIWARVLIAVVALAFYKNIVHMWEGLPLFLHLELFLLGILHNILPSLWMEWSGSLVGPLVMHVVWDLLVYAPMGSIPYWVI